MVLLCGCYVSACCSFQYLSEHKPWYAVIPHQYVHRIQSAAYLALLNNVHGNFQYHVISTLMYLQVKVEKFITPDQQAKLDEEAKVEAEKKLKEKGDNVRDRALNMMMGGVLEIKKEDELKKV